MDGASVTAKSFAGRLGTGWSIESTEDFTDDGKADILTRSADDVVSAWEMNAGDVADTGLTGNLWSDLV